MMTGNLLKPVVMVIGLVVVALGSVEIWRSDLEEKPPVQHCYFVIDQNGHEYESEFGPYFGDYGIYWDTNEAWGVVTDPAGMRVDKDCLRSKGVDVDAVTDHGYDLP